MSAPAKNPDLHGFVPDNSPVALLLIDMINDFEWEGAEGIFPRALAAAKAVAALKRRARDARVPVVYVNDNFGKWRSDFRNLLEHVLHGDVRGQPIAELLQPDEQDYFVLKPKHSGFHSTTLEVLLEYLGAETLILAGYAGNFCVMFTAHDAYMRDFGILVPGDCVASLTEAHDRYALEHMAKICKADTRPSTVLDLKALAAAR
jgi:nicotinamidase-related amidase